MKKNIFIMLLLVLATCTGCVRVYLDNSDSKGGFVRIAESKEPMKQVEYQVGEYHSVEFDIIIWDENFNGNPDLLPEMIYSSQESDTVTIEMPEDMEQYISVTVKDGTLVIKGEVGFLMNQYKHPKIYISNPNLEKILVKSALQVKNGDTVIVDRFQLDIAGLCDIQLPLEVKELNVYISGSGDMRLRGTADKAYYEISGSGNIEAEKLKSEKSTVSIYGAGNVSVNTINTLNVDISGAGNVTYRGAPVVTSQISGVGNIEKE